MSKVYVDALTEFSEDGKLIPKSIRLENGINYTIDLVKDYQRVANVKAGGVGQRYTCEVNGKELYLYYEDNNMWFMEK